MGANYAPRRPRPHQQEALDALHAAFTDCPRAQLIQACGTGKTLVGRWYAQQCRATVVVVAVPSLALVAQTLQEWRSERSWPFEALVTCSDPSTAAGVDERRDADGQDVAAPFWTGLRARVTTNAGVVAQRLVGHDAEHPLVIFSTYHSVHVVAAAVRSVGLTVDLVIADEAHVLGGWPRSEFRVVLDDGEMSADKRLFMTATPVLIDPDELIESGDLDGDSGTSTGALSMSDAAVFGPVAHRLDFAEAIAAGLLVDYRVVVYDTSGQKEPDPVSALLTAADHGLSSVLSFHGRVAKARAFAAAVDGLALPDGRTVVARAVAGIDPQRVREQALATLRESDPQTTLVVISSARCLSVGVDIPAVDGVLFADPKYSDVDVIQSVGRALRPAPDKQRGLVMIPVSIPAGIDDDTALSTGAFSAVWRILRGLRSMDERLATEIAASWRTSSRRGIPDGSGVGARISFELPASADLAAIRARVVDFLCPAWDLTFNELQSFVAEHGHARPPQRPRLGQWCERQRRAHRSGVLSAERAARLAELPGWAWNLSDHRWLQQWAQVSELAGDGGLDVGSEHVGRIALKQRGRQSAVRTVGRWAAEQRQRHRRGELEQWRAHKLVEIPGWSWRAVPDSDAAAVDLLAEYVTWKGHANPAADVVEDGVQLGRWLNDLRRRRATGNLSQPLLDEVEVATPATEGKVQWLRGATLWLLGLEALRQFAAREGHCVPRDGHAERLADTSIELFTWCSRQRYLHRHGRMLPARVRMLEQVDGWQWERPPAPRVRLDIGDLPHGQRSGYVKGCRCTPCTEANSRDRAARDAGEIAADWVCAGAARAHLQKLIAAGVGRKALARASGLERKTVAAMVSGDRQRIRAATEEKILALDIATARAALAPMACVDATETWKLLDALIARGWPKAWIARESGLGKALQLNRDKVTAGNAAKVAALAARLGERIPPPRRGRQPLPTLVQILEGTVPSSDVTGAAGPALTVAPEAPAVAAIANQAERSGQSQHRQAS